MVYYILKLDGNLTKFNEIYHLKRRKVTTTRKMFLGIQAFTEEETGKKIEFNVYTDRDCGFSREWQKKLKKAEMDDDIKTDDEQLDLAKRHIFKELNEGFKNFKKKKLERKKLI